MSNSLIFYSYRKNDLTKLACKTSSVIDQTNNKKHKNLYTKLIKEAKIIIIQKTLTAKRTCKKFGPE